MVSWWVKIVEEIHCLLLLCWIDVSNHSISWFGKIWLWFEIVDPQMFWPITTERHFFCGPSLNQSHGHFGRIMTYVITKVYFAQSCGSSAGISMFAWTHPIIVSIYPAHLRVVNHWSSHSLMHSHQTIIKLDIRDSRRQLRCFSYLFIYAIHPYSSLLPYKWSKHCDTISSDIIIYIYALYIYIYIIYI